MRKAEAEELEGKEPPLAARGEQLHKIIRIQEKFQKKLQVVIANLLYMGSIDR